jgi:hypothetical protein
MVHTQAACPGPCCQPFCLENTLRFTKKENFLGFADDFYPSHPPCQHTHCVLSLCPSASSLQNSRAERRSELAEERGQGAEVPRAFEEVMI